MTTKTIAGMFEKDELAQVIKILTGQLAECKDLDLIQVRVTVSTDEDTDKERMSIGSHFLTSGHGVIGFNAYNSKKVGKK